MKRLSLHLAPLALAVLGSACAPSAELDSPPPLSSSDVAGSNAPTVQTVDLAGLQAALEAHHGKAILLNFWATWCAPCVEELPELLEVHQEFRERGGEVVLVSYDLMIPGPSAEEMLAKVQAFVDSNGYSMDQLLYNADDYDSINAALQLPGPVPVTLAFDPKGREVDRQEGKAGKARFIDMMGKALAVRTE